jgi:2-keto-4-pentenoate hydratase/2-oxohepta-3-ene-1,7-dioic acid hydratase in catechol pathway
VNTRVITAAVMLTAWSCAQDSAPSMTPIEGDSNQYARFSVGGGTHLGVMQNGRLMVVAGDLFGEHGTTGESFALDDVTLLPPTEPSKVIAVGLNYRSHLGDRPVASEPGLFAKYPTSLSGHEAPIVYPADAGNLHYEGEMVLIIGKTAHNVPIENALDYLFGVTVGNDVSERDWQASDLQWFRAKASDGFGPVGPFLVTGVDPDNLPLTVRLNGEVRQEGNTNDLLFDASTIISYVSRYVTLYPGDMVFTGTPGTTTAMSPGDVVEVELGGVGILRNTVVAAQ